jgi:hypothetical protein
MIMVVIGNNGAFGGPNVRCLKPTSNLVLDLVNNTIGPVQSTQPPTTTIYRPAVDIFSIATLTVTTTPNGLLHLGYQLTNTPVLNSPILVYWWNAASPIVITDQYNSPPVKSDGTKLMDITLVRMPIPGDMIAVAYSTIEP